MLPKDAAFRFRNYSRAEREKNMSERKIKITQIRSVIGYDITQKETVRALGLRRIRSSVVHNATPQILGMVNKVKHLLAIEEA